MIEISEKDFARLMNGMRGLPLCYICSAAGSKECSQVCEDNFRLNRSALVKSGITANITGGKDMLEVSEKDLKQLLKLLKTELIECDVCANKNGAGCVCPYLERFALDPKKAEKYGITVKLK